MSRRPEGTTYHPGVREAILKKRAVIRAYRDGMKEVERLEKASSTKPRRVRPAEVKDIKDGQVIWHKPSGRGDRWTWHIVSLSTVREYKPVRWPGAPRDSISYGADNGDQYDSLDGWVEII